jgi:hypothetical protein
VILFISLSRPASAFGFNPAFSSLLKTKLSISFLIQSFCLTAGTVAFTGFWKDQWFS